MEIDDVVVDHKLGVSITNEFDCALVEIESNLDADVGWGKYDQAREIFDRLMTIQPRPVSVREGWHQLQDKIAKGNEDKSAATN